MLIIADDITGAAEIAGIAWRKGLKVRLMVYQPNMPTTPLSSWRGAGGEVLILATDTRSGTEEEAVKTIETLFNSPLQGGVGGGLIFKKTDSVLRGHVAAELEALMRLTGKSNTLLIPQNPSKRRIVKDGIYYINGTPLDQTSFAYDPEFPAKTSLVNKLISRRVDELNVDCRGGSAYPPENQSNHRADTQICPYNCSFHSLRPSPEGEDGRGLHFPDATNLEEIREHVAKADPNTLFAGGADMFEAVVDYLLGEQECRSAGVQTLPSSTSNLSTCQLVNLSTCEALNSSTCQLAKHSTCEALNSSTEKILILCGSTQSRSLINEPFFADKNAIEVTMPEDVFHGTASIHETNAWIATLKDHWQNHDAMIVRIGHEATGGKEYAVRLRKLFGEMAYQILSPDQGVQTLPSNTNNSSTCQLVNSSTCEALNLSTCEALNSSTDIILEGGATAYTVLERLAISSFDVEYEYSPGVVCLSHGNMRIILKPGSYPWGNLFEEL
jgi:hypothetical protein